MFARSVSFTSFPFSISSSFYFLMSSSLVVPLFSFSYPFFFPFYFIPSWRIDVLATQKWFRVHFFLTNGNISVALYDHVFLPIQPSPLPLLSPSKDKTRYWFLTFPMSPRILGWKAWHSYRYYTCVGEFIKGLSQSHQHWKLSRPHWQRGKTDKGYRPQYNLLQPWLFPWGQFPRHQLESKFPKKFLWTSIMGLWLLSKHTNTHPHCPLGSVSSKERR